LEDDMNVLVAYASRHGATRGIAERITETLRRHDLDVSLKSVEDAGRVDLYDAFVIGSAAYMGRWMSEATRFVETNSSLLAGRPVWLFSSGPVGMETTDAKGRDVVEASRPAEFGLLADRIHPRDRRIFFGAFDPEAKPANLVERLGAPFLRMPAVRQALPAGDFRDWEAIEAWAEEIARELEGAPVPSA
jgi:menaquinone-dependent protoporphyrinogen oxidase